MIQGLRNGIGQATIPDAWASASSLRWQQGTQLSSSLGHPNYLPFQIPDLQLPSAGSALMLLRGPPKLDQNLVERVSRG